MIDATVQDDDDAEYVEKYGLHKVDRLKLEAAAHQLFTAAAAWGKRSSDTDAGTLMNALYDASLNYAAVRLHVLTKIVPPPQSRA